MNGDIPTEVLTWCREQALFAPGSRVTCAVSGGADSMVMLDLLCMLAEPLGITVTAAHFHHGLRGSEADRDADFVRDFCAARGIPFRCGHGRAAEHAARTGQSVEQAARELRYAFLQEAAAGGTVATAHTADDHLETLLINLIRGTSLRGLCGIPPVRGNIVRPVLCLDRRQVARWLALRDLPHVEDSTNRSRDYLRCRLRQDVLPALLAEAPDLPAAAVEQARLLRADADCLDTMGRALLERAEAPGGLQIPVLLEEPAAIYTRAVLFWLRRCGVRDPGHVHVQAVCDLMQTQQGSARLDLPGGVTVCRTYDLLCTGTQQPAPAPALLPVPGCLFWGSWRIAAETVPCWDGTVPPDGHALALPALPVTVRSRLPGDRLHMPGRGSSLKRLLMDHRIPAPARDGIPILCAGETILCAGPLARNADCAAAAGQAALLLHFSEKECVAK